MTICSRQVTISLLFSLLLSRVSPPSQTSETLPQRTVCITKSLICVNVADEPKSKTSSCVFTAVSGKTGVHGGFSDIAHPLSWQYQYKSALDLELFVFTTSDKHPKLLMFAFSFLFKGQKSADRLSQQIQTQLEKPPFFFPLAPSAVRMTHFS